MDDLSGRKVRDYELRERIGAGGFGAVYRAWQPSVDRDVAVKVILPEFANHPDFKSRFEAEAKMVARLEHPYIIPLHDYWRDEEGAFLVMRWLKGGSLRECIEDGPVELAQLSQLMEQIGGALAFSHEHGVIHRDLKPENILLDEDENAYLTDFGIAKDLSGPSVTETGKIIGSVDYLAPEQAKGEPITPRTDIYALGVVLYELLTCEHPFPDSTPIQMIQKQLNEPLPSIVVKRPDLPMWIDEIIGRATAKAPEDRYPDVEALLGDFRLAMTAPEQRVMVPELPAFLAGESEPIERKREVFVARERELAWFDDALGASVEGQGSVHFVVGNSGRGKTALLVEFMRRAEEKIPDLLVASGTCNMHSGVGDAYLPFRQILELLTGDVERGWRAGRVSSDLARKLWTNVPNIAGDLVEIAPDLINRLVPGPALAARVKTAGGATQSWWPQLNQLVEQERFDAEELKQAFLFEQCSRFLRNVSQEAPLLLVLDDLQWADAASIGLLFHLGRSIASSRILLIGAYRPDEVALGRVSPVTGQSERHPMESVVNEMKRIHGETTLDLGQEDTERDRAFVDAFLDTEPNELDEAFRRALYEHAEGHPLFTVELLRAMQDRGELVQGKGGGWRPGTELNWAELPARVEAVIEERIDHLPSNQREILSIASVEGDEFTAQVISAVLNQEERRLLRELSRELEKRHRLVRELDELRVGSRSISRYRFTHHMFQQYLYLDISIGERRLLHGEIAARLEEFYEKDTGSISVQLAHHYIEAKKAAKAAKFLLQSAELAQHRGANIEALSHFERALRVMPDVEAERRWQALSGIVRVQRVLGQLERSLENSVVLVALADEIDDPKLLADTHFIRGNVLFDTGSAREALQELDQALAAARSARDYHREAHIQAFMLVPLSQVGENEVGKEIAEGVISTVDEVDDDLIRAKIFTNLATFYGRIGDGSKAVELLHRQLELTDRLGHLVGKAIGYLNLGYELIQLGMNSEGIAATEQSISISAQIGYKQGVVINSWNLCLANLRLEKTGAAERALEDVADQVEGNPYQEAFQSLYRGLLGEAKKKFSNAMAKFREAHNKFADMDNAAGASDAVAGVARCALDLEKLDEANQNADVLMSYLKAHGVAGMELPILAYITCADVYERAGDQQKYSWAVSEGQRELAERAGKISDPEMRKSFLENIPEHRVVRTASATLEE